MEKPYIRKERYPCPFYGFYGDNIIEIMVEQGGNKCALITPSHSPCRMEIDKKTPDWNKCPINPEESGGKPLIDSTNNIKVFPKEFHPQNKRSWGGMDFKDWMNYVMEGSDSNL